MLAVCTSAHAASVHLNGVVTSIEGINPPAQTGDLFTAHLAYNPITRVVDHASVAIDAHTYRYQSDDTTSVTQDARPCEGVLSYGVGSSAYLRVVLFASFPVTPSCSIPSLPFFQINEFTFRLPGNVISGVLTEIPKVRP